LGKFILPLQEKRHKCLAESLQLLGPFGPEADALSIELDPDKYWLCLLHNKEIQM
jgi:hypothetical protein